MSTKTTLRVALDWTPNTIHTGLFLALSNGLYSSAGLDVHLLPPDPAYTTTPAKQLETGAADLAICPSESCIAYAENGKMQLQAIYAILQRDASAIFSANLGRMAELGASGGGRVYGSYNARFEDAIVRAMVQSDGGEGDAVRIERQKGKLSLFEAARKGEVDATWVFVPWEGVEAGLEGAQGSYFRLEDFGIPYGYSPVVARRVGGEGEVDGEVLEKFVQATREAYEIVSNDVRAGVDALKPFCRPERSEEFLMKSQASIYEFYKDGNGQLGAMSEAKWKTWVEWLEEQKMLKAGAVNVDSIFTNEFNS